ncbi:MAG: GNAT family N-acetyltransferase [Oscillochloridaceae bacterium]|nr:GNAT family N-acetyltransferase [Chloroflexaceae bacterium]MDW8390652.1 GNAT family N-acetyltransferase [Oscillochloridaceae bacterium]
MSQASTESAAQTPAAPPGLIIREFSGSEADYAAAVAVCNAAFPEYPESVEEWKEHDQRQPPHLKCRRWLAETEGEAVGFASYDQPETMYHPRLFTFFAAVRPERQGQGVGRALYATVTAALAPLDPLRIRAHCRSDYARSMRFLTERGFVEDRREWESRLAVAGFDPAPFAGHVERVLASGIRIVTLRELIEGDPEHRRKLYDLDVTLARDVPSPEPFTAPSPESFERYVFENRDLLPEGFFVAIDGQRYVGLSALWKSEKEPDTLYTGLTGVRREYRRRGIALALKLCAIEYARRHGIQTLKTWNESSNQGMLSINEALGFVKQPAWVSFVKRLQSEA